MAVDPRDFLLNTDYEMDKIIYFVDRKVTPDQYGNVKIAHNLPFTPLLTGVWSKTSNFSEPHDFFSSPVFYSSTEATNKYVIDSVDLYADPTNINLSLKTGNELSPTIYDFYVRIFGFEPSNLANTTPATSQNASKFVLNTDYNYLKLHSKGIENVTYDGNYNPNPITIRHNLGYIPQALFWTENSFNGAILEMRQFDTMITASTSAIGGQSYTSPQSCIEAYTDRFIVYPEVAQSGDSSKIHYRIYYDEAI